MNPQFEYRNQYTSIDQVCKYKYLRREYNMFHYLSKVELTLDEDWENLKKLA